MIKKIVIAALLFSASYGASAQHYYREGERNRERDTYQDEETYGDGFKKEHLFIGGNLGLGYDSYTFGAGISPEIGYSLKSWLDVGVLTNFNYTSIRADPYYNGNIRQRSFNYGTGVFASFYPLPFLYLQVRPEYNWIHYTQTDMNYNPHPSASFTTNAPSLLVGIGYGQRLVGRSKMNLTLMIDLINSNQSPYRDFNGAVIPVLKAGFDIYFHPRKQ
ncbi:MAG: autotransporter outer membrane beta-barrel domain-containing protein [Chitinophagaceae bacterium]